jgi:hypothetical protein
MTEKTLREPEMGLTFEKVWVMFQESDRPMQERTDRIVQENTLQMKETDRILREMELRMKDTYRQMKETGRKISVPEGFKPRER